MIFTEQIASKNLDVFLPMIPALFRNSYSGSNDMRFYGIESDGEAEGVMIVAEEKDIARIRYMYLLPPKRGLGHMDRAMAHVLVELKREGFSKAVMDYIPSEYKAVARISTRFGFEDCKSDRSYFRFSVDQIRKSKALSYEPQGIVRLRALPEPVRREAYNQVQSKGYDISHMTEVKEIVTNVEEHSLVYLEQNKPMGLMMVQDLTESSDPAKEAVFGKVFPEGSSADIALVYVGSTQMKAPLYLMSALCRNILREYEGNDIITGFFPESHLTKLLEGTLGIRGQREVTAVIDLTTMEVYDE